MPSLPLVLVSLLSAGNPSPASLVPPDAVLYAELREPGRWIEEFRNSSFYAGLKDLGILADLEKNPEMKNALGMVKAFEAAAQMPATEAIQILTAQSLGFAMFPGEKPKKPSLLLLIQGSDPALAKRLVETVASLAAFGRQGAEIDSDEEESFALVKVPGKFAAAAKGSLVALSNDPGLVDQALSRLRNPENPSLRGKKEFGEILQAAEHPNLGFAFLDLAALRPLLLKRRVAPEKAPNVLGALLIGGALQALHASERAGLALDSEGRTLHARIFSDAILSGDSPFVVRPQTRKGMFLLPEGTIAHLRWRRDLTGFWSEAERHVEEGDLAKVAEFNTNMGILFGGRKFDSEVLPELGEEVELVVARQGVEGLRIPPRRRYPGAALIFDLKDPARMAGPLQIAFQTGVGFANVDRGKHGNPGLLLSSEDADGTSIAFARFLPPAEDDGPVPNYYNVSPASAVVGDRFILGSSLPLVRELVRGFDPKRQTVAEEGDSWTNDSLHLDAGALRRILAENEESLIANNMLEKMHDRPSAQREVRTFLQLVGLFQSLDVEQKIGKGRLEYEIRLTAR